MTNWKEYKLGEIGTIARGKSKYRPRDASHLYSGKYPFIQTGDIKAANHKLIKFSQTYSEEGLKQSKLWPKGTICITIAANIADTAILTFPACFPDSVIGFVANEELCNIDFIEYLLQYYRMQIKSHSIGSVQDNINLGTFEKIKFKIPDLPSQTAIAEILSSLDDKIELNNKINQELENLAQTLFKQWFIDFEFPDENGNPYKSTGGEMVDSELGEIPKGWAVKSLEEIAEINLGGTPSRNKDEFWSGDIPWVNSGAINENYILNPVELITELGLNKSSTKLIPKYSTLIAITGATLGQVSYSLIDACYNQSVISLTSEKDINEFLHLLIGSIIPELVKHQTGGAQQHINKGNVENFKVIVPSVELLEYFKSVVIDVYLQIEYNLRENQELNSLRDILLPKLISGELEVSDISLLI